MEHFSSYIYICTVEMKQHLVLESLFNSASRSQLLKEVMQDLDPVRPGVNKFVNSDG